MKESSNLSFSEQNLQKVKEILSRYPQGKEKSALLPLLHMAEAEFGGWLSPEVMDYVATILNIQPIEVYEVATFYSMFNLKPTGKYVLEVCRTGPCCLRGAENLLDKIEEKLGIKVGETSADGLFTLKTVECLASCGTAPMMQVGDKYYENLNEENIETVLQSFRNN